MPELPEVETIKVGLTSLVVGHTIKELVVLEKKTVQISEEDINRFILGQSINSVTRRAKVLIWGLDNGYSILFHLKMTGQVIVTYGDSRFSGGHPTQSMLSELPDASTRAFFGLSNGYLVYFNDQRKFGWIKLLRTNQTGSEKLLSRVGPEPLGPDFIFEEFWKKIKNRKTSIKAVLLDQTTVAGIGNIYADETLHLAKVNPQKQANKLKKSEALRIFNGIKETLSLGIKYGGTTITNYRNSTGGTGKYQEHSRVFRREGQKCPVCGDIILKTKVAGRGTHYCPTCQKK